MSVLLSVICPHSPKYAVASFDASNESGIIVLNVAIIAVKEHPMPVIRGISEEPNLSSISLSPFVMKSTSPLTVTTLLFTLAIICAISFAWCVECKDSTPPSPDAIIY